MNGQTGKFVGDLPLDKVLRAKIFVGATALLTLIFTIAHFVTRL